MQKKKFGHTEFEALIICYKGKKTMEKLLVDRAKQEVLGPHHSPGQPLVILYL